MPNRNDRLKEAETELRSLGFPPVDAVRYGRLGQRIVALKSMLRIQAILADLEKEKARLASARKLLVIPIKPM